MTLHTGDCVEVMASMPAESVDAIVTDPPYLIGFMGRTWDRSELGWHEAWAREAFRVARPGAHLLAFGGTRTYHRLASAIEDAGWEIRDCLVWAYACLSDDTEILTSEGWVRYNSASEGQHAAAFDTATGAIRWEPIQAVHRYHHEGEMAVIGPSLVTLNHRVVLDADEATVPRLPSVWNDVHAARRMVEEGTTAGVLQAVQRQAPATRPALQDRYASGLDRGVVGVLPREHEWREQPGLEGRRYRVQEAWELLRGALRPSSRVGAADGAQGRVRDGAPATDGRPVRLLADQDRMREPRESRPDRQSPREPEPVAGQPDPQALRVGKGDRGYGLSADAPSLVDYAGVVWCITVPSGAFVARRNGVIFVTGNSGFPKSLDVGKAMDKRGGAPHLAVEIAGAIKAARESRGWTTGQADRHFCGGTTNWTWYEGRKGDCRPPTPDDFARIAAEWPELATLAEKIASVDRELGGTTNTACSWFPDPCQGHDDGTSYGAKHQLPTLAATDLARQWEGWGTALKPSWEPIVMARKPLRGTVAGNVTQYGTGALNIDATRIGTTKDVPASPRGPQDRIFGTYAAQNGSESGHNPNIGRWPANLILTDPIFDGDVEGVVGGGTTSSGELKPYRENHEHASSYRLDRDKTYTSAADSGTYSRFFLVPKSSRADREPVVRGQLAEREVGVGVWAPETGHAEYVFPLPAGIGEWLREQRQAAGLSAKELCARIGAHGEVNHGGAVANWEAELARPSPDQWRSLRSALGFNDRFDEVMTSTRDMPPGPGLAPEKNPRHPRENAHPTVKPVELMRHLVRLVTPPGGTVLDCFAGSGSTLIAAEQEGFQWIGIEKEPEYVAIAEARLHGTQRGLGLDVGAPTRKRSESAGKASGYNWEESVNDNPTRIARNIKSGVHYGDGPRKPPKPVKAEAVPDSMWSDEDPAA